MALMRRRGRRHALDRRRCRGAGRRARGHRHLAALDPAFKALTLSAARGVARRPHHRRQCRSRQDPQRAARPDRGAGVAARAGRSRPPIAPMRRRRPIRPTRPSRATRSLQERRAVAAGRGGAARGATLAPRAVRRRHQHDRPLRGAGVGRLRAGPPTPRRCSAISAPCSPPIRWCSTSGWCSTPSRPSRNVVERIARDPRRPGFPAEQSQPAARAGRHVRHGNPTQFARADGDGFRFVTEFVADVDKRNPQVAARVLTAFRVWRSFEPVRRAAAEAALEGAARCRRRSAAIPPTFSSGRWPVNEIPNAGRIFLRRLSDFSRLVNFRRVTSGGETPLWTRASG